MKYKVHKVDVTSASIEKDLQLFLNELKGEVVSILPAIKKGSIAQLYSVTERVDHLLIIEKIK